jgi:hypothetical protein
LLLTLQRAGKIQIESTSFTVSEPTAKYTIEPIIYTLADSNQKSILSNDYDIIPFEIEIVTLERIFIDKIFATEFYYVRNCLFDVSKHLYDICNLLNNIKIQELLNNEELLSTLVSYKRQEELRRKGGIDTSLKVKDFSYFKLEKEEELKKALVSMQDKYVINKNTVIDIASLKNNLEILYKVFEELEQ